MSVSMSNLSKLYGDIIAVHDLTLECPTGQMLGLLGPSGCGKSSTLKMIAGIEEVSSGQICFGAKDVTYLPPGARNIAMVFEDYALYAHLSVFENIAFPLRIQKLPKKEIEQRVDAMLEMLRLTDIRDEKVRQLSGGAQQRVSIGRALVRKPEVILFDEPLSHLDADQKIQLRSELKRLQQIQGLTSLLVTHDQTEAIAMCDIIAVMNLGELQQVGEPQALYDSPANTFVAQFIGEPQMNLLPARLQRRDEVLFVQGKGWTLRLDDRFEFIRDFPECELILGIRPEQMTLSTGDVADGIATLEGEVQFREHRGDTDVLLVDLESGDPSGTRGARISADIPGPSAVREGDWIRLSFDNSKIILFDKGSGKNLAQKAETGASVREVAA
tara:strand:+ start:19199 stop:20356 length:1158 start_codon:yes stop_codon:yes gene_type:complete